MFLVEKKTVKSGLFGLFNRDSSTIENQLSSIDREGGAAMHPIEDVNFGNNVANTTPYYNMILCHSLAINDELVYTKYLRKVTARANDERRDRLAKALVDSFKGKSIIEALEMIKFKTVQDFFDRAMQISIETKRELISFDMIQFAIRSGFQMAITVKQVHVLIESKMYDVIEALINSNSLLKID